MDSRRVQDLPSYTQDIVLGQRLSSADLSGVTGDPSWASAIRIADLLKALGIKSHSPLLFAQSLGAATHLFNRNSSFVRTADAWLFLEQVDEDDDEAAEMRAEKVSDVVMRLMREASTRRHAREDQDPHTITLDAPPTGMRGWVLQNSDGKVLDSATTPDLPVHPEMEQDRVRAADVYEPAEDRTARISATNGIIGEVREGGREARARLTIPAPEFANAIPVAPAETRSGRLWRAFRVVEAALTTAEAIAAETQPRHSFAGEERMTEDEFTETVTALAKTIEAQGKTVSITQQNELLREPNEDGNAYNRITVKSRTVHIVCEGLDLHVKVLPGVSTLGIMVAALRAVASAEAAPEGC